MLKISLKFSILFFFCSLNLGLGLSYGQLEAAITKADKKILKEYHKLHRSFSKELCTAALEHKYFRLLRDYRGNGNYIPLLKNEIDYEAIQSHIELFRQKKAWIESQAKYLKKLKSWPRYNLITRHLRESLKNLLTHKKDYFLAISQEKKEDSRRKSIIELKRFRRYFDEMIEKVPFLTSFSYPVDHLKNRREYEEFKEKEGIENEKKANSKFFYRRILEDGALDPNNTRGDKYLRSTLDTIKLKIDKTNIFLTEEIRYDLEYVLGKISRQLGRGRSVQLARMNAWRLRTSEKISFYLKLIKHKDKNKGLIEQKLQANDRLKDFVNGKLTESYLFWHNKPEQMKKLYVLTTILFNEVGDVDGPDALERYDVARVVRNRILTDEYRYLPADQDLYKSLRKKLSDEEIQNEYWLNALFKKGEFSFTFFYLSGVTKVFCPDMTRRGRKLRAKNLEISLRVLKGKTKDEFDALRYFSRASMNGRIDMSTVWDDYKLLDERPGLLSKRQKYLKRLYLADKYQYLYSFKSENISFQVLEMDSKTYVMDWRAGEPVFYRYRNPHYFKYFSKR